MHWSYCSLEQSHRSVIGVLIQATIHQRRRHSIANPLELRLFCIKPSIEKCHLHSTTHLYFFLGQVWAQYLEAYVSVDNSDLTVDCLTTPQFVVAAVTEWPAIPLPAAVIGTHRRPLVVTSASSFAGIAAGCTGNGRSRHFVRGKFDVGRGRVGRYDLQDERADRWLLPHLVVVHGNSSAGIAEGGGIVRSFVIISGSHVWNNHR